MNDFERKLSEQSFRPPPGDLRAAIFGSAETVTNIVAPVAPAWRDWFWPSPLAWGALAALWLLFAVISIDVRPAGGSSAIAAQTPAPEVGATLLSYHQSRNLDHALDLAN